MIGTQVGNYRIEGKLGSGGMGTVYRAVELNLDRVVAIKVLNPEFGRQPEVLKRFRAEAKAQANLNHPNIATLFAFVIQEGDAMMVMEFVDGENFQEAVKRRGAIPHAKAIPLFQQALAGIGAAHRMGIVHRDIKPANIMLNKQGVVKVMDFGIAKLGGERGLTRTGSQVGTVFYMSPEQVKGQTVDQRSDIYALGVTLYEILTARVPFTAESEFEVLSGHVHTAPPPLSTYAAIPKGIELAVLKALAKKPDDRFQTVGEFAAALSYEASLGMAATADAIPIHRTPDLDATRPPPSRPLERRKREPAWVAFVIGLGTVAGLGLGAFLLLPQKPGIVPAHTKPAPVEAKTAAPERPPQPVVVQVTIPADTDVVVRLTSPVSVASAVEGQVFSATVESPPAAQGDAQVRLIKSVKAKRFKGAARMEFELNSLLSGGKLYRLHTSRYRVEGTRGKFLGFGGGALKIAPGAPMTFTLTEPLTMTAR